MINVILKSSERKIFSERNLIFISNLSIKKSPAETGGKIIENKRASATEFFFFISASSGLLCRILSLPFVLHQNQKPWYTVINTLPKSWSLDCSLGATYLPNMENFQLNQRHETAET